MTTSTRLLRRFALSVSLTAAISIAASVGCSSNSARPQTSGKGTPIHAAPGDEYDSVGLACGLGRSWLTLRPSDRTAYREVIRTEANQFSKTGHGADVAFRMVIIGLDDTQSLSKLLDYCDQEGHVRESF